MTREDTENIMKQAANNLQGFYGRFYYNTYMNLSEDEKDEYCDVLTEAGVHNMLDFVMFMEG